MVSVKLEVSELLGVIRSFRTLGVIRIFRTLGVIRKEFRTLGVIKTWEIGGWETVFLWSIGTNRHFFNP